jgi:hypothetical protein
LALIRGPTQSRPLLEQERTSREGDGTDVDDPIATLAVHCGNGFDAGFNRIKVLPIGCRLLSLGAGMKRHDFITLLGGTAVGGL